MSAARDSLGSSSSPGVPLSGLGASTANLLARLRHVLAGPLPGRAAHARYEPELAFGRHGGPPPRSARRAAVAALLYECGCQWCVPLTVRPIHLARHGGQISLPGGLIEPGESIERAALRELDEELGVAAGDVATLGRLSPLYLYATDFLIAPLVAVAAARPAFRPSDAEVAEIVELPLQAVIAGASPRRAQRRFRELTFGAPVLSFDGHEVWGATAMILAELADAFVAAQHA